jgi:hypothetical protein
LTHVLIDLDLAGTPPVVSRRRRWAGLSRARLRIALAALLAVVVAATCAAAAVHRAGFPPPVPIPADESDEFTVADDGVYVLRQQGHEVRSYGLDGRLRWAASIRAGADLQLVEVAADVVLSPEGPYGTVALDRSTGAVRWRSPARLFAVKGDLVVLTLNGAELPDDEVQRLVGVNASDGREQWQVGIRLEPTQWMLTVVPSPVPGTGGNAGLGVINQDGTGVLLDLVSGTWRRLTGLPVSRPDEWFQWFHTAIAVGRHLVVHSTDRSGIEQVQVYGPTSPAPLWTVRTNYRAGPMCGPWLCVDQAASTQVLDLRTGAEVKPGEWPLIVTGPRPIVSGFATRLSDATIARFDPSSGRVVPAYAGWIAASAPYAGWVPILLQRDATRWQLASLRLADGVAYRLGAFEPYDDPLRACRSAAHYIACAVSGGGLLLWRYRPRNAPPADDDVDAGR